jgi:hypothetical protein
LSEAKFVYHPGGRWPQVSVIFQLTASLSESMLN